MIATVFIIMEGRPGHKTSMHESASYPGYISVSGTAGKRKTIWKLDIQFIKRSPEIAHVLKRRGW
jgi:hypothetical protein